jgi:hypothetical protein
MEQNEDGLEGTNLILQNPAVGWAVGKNVGRRKYTFGRDDLKGSLVEAAGVEPASEKARREENYVRFRFGDCRPPR